MPVRHLLFRFQDVHLEVKDGNYSAESQQGKTVHVALGFFIAGMKQCRELAAQWLSLMIRTLRWQITVSAGGLPCLDITR